MDKNDEGKVDFYDNDERIVVVDNNDDASLSSLDDEIMRKGAEEEPCIKIDQWQKLGTKRM